jgi:hypothetical protein
VGEWSIADTDCALYVNSVGSGYPPERHPLNFQEVDGKARTAEPWGPVTLADQAAQERQVARAKKQMRQRIIIAICIRPS